MAVEKLALKLHNTLSGQDETFTASGVVTMYNCGPTVYQYAHIGNLRSYVFADILKRALIYNDYKVKQVINITDVGHNQGDADEGEDKMEVSARAQKKSASELARFYTDAFLKDLDLLNVDTEGTLFPRATAHIKEQIELIETLEKKGFVYTTSDGVYFDTSKFPAYGKLGKIDLAGLEEGKRVAINKEKRNPTDFAVWKFSPNSGAGPTVKREQEWPSPWGVGFPGWHIECSAMVMKLLGQTIDIHTGGIDHIPVHHNNEIAQSEAATGQPFARFWLHNAFLNIDGAKIAKSVGNTFYLSDVVAKGITPLAYRYWLLGATYRTNMNFTWEALEASQTAYKKLVAHVSKLQTEVGEDGAEKNNKEINKNYSNKFQEAINDDLNTPRAIALIWDLIKDESVPSLEKLATIANFDQALGFDLVHQAELLADQAKTAASAEVPADIQTLIEAREAARAQKDYQKADQLRTEIEKKGHKVVDATLN